MTVFEALVDLYHLPSNFNAHNGRKLLDAYPDYPVYATVLYLLMVFYLPGYLKKRNKYYEFKWLTASWNLALSIISTVGSYYTIQLLYDYVFVERGFHKTACVLHVFSDGSSLATPTVKSGYASAPASAVPAVNGTGSAEPVIHSFLSMTSEERQKLLSSCYVGPKVFYVALFLYLKTPELLDTVFLILQDKPVSFLHWFHHIVTAIYSWHSGYTLIPAGVFFTVMNYSVHSIMYFYFFLVVMGLRRKIRWFAPVITLLQCLQMFGGIAVTCYTYLQYWLGPAHKGELFYMFFQFLFSACALWKAQVLSVMRDGRLLSWSEVPAFKMSDHFYGCDTDPTNLRMGVMMYGTYCVLFGVLFKELYLDKRANRHSIVLARREKRPEVVPSTAKVDGPSTLSKGTANGHRTAQ